MIEQYDQTNVFARIINGELPCSRVFENEYVLAFHDINPQAKIHVLVVPKKAYISFSDFMQNADQLEIAIFFESLWSVVKSLNLAEKSYRIVSNIGSTSGQTVMHFHMHILANSKMTDQV